MKSARVLSIVILMSVTGAAFADGPFHYPDDTLFKPWPNISRAQIVGELVEAENLGLISVGGGVPSETAAQEQAITDAGRRAAEQSKVAAK